MKVQVDRDLCQGHARCNVIAPDVFHQDEEGFSYTSDADVPPEAEERVRKALLNCPESAIRILK